MTGGHARARRQTRDEELRALVSGSLRHQRRERKVSNALRCRGGDGRCDVVIVNAGRTLPMASPPKPRRRRRRRSSGDVIGAGVPAVPDDDRVVPLVIGRRAPLVAALGTASAPPSAAPAAPAGRAGRADAAAGCGAAGNPLNADDHRSGKPTVGFIWGDGPTGYSIKCAWRAASPIYAGRIVLVTDRRLGAESESADAVCRRGRAGSADAGFTVVECDSTAKAWARPRAR